MTSSNPALNKVFFTPQGTTKEATMTIEGTIFKTAFLLTIALTSFTWFWHYVESFQQAQKYLILTGGIAFLLSIVTIFNPKSAPFTSPIYALVEGMTLGVLTRILEYSYPGIPTLALSLTFFTLGAMLLTYSLGIIEVNEKFRSILLILMTVVFLFSLLNFLCYLFATPILSVYNPSLFSIFISIIVVGIAALNLLLDFEFIVQGQRLGLPKYMEWYSAFSLMITLVWLYMEILRLLIKLSRRRR